MLSSDADSLYWMSRYLERAEHTVRVLDVNSVLMLDDSPDFEGLRWQRLLAALHIPIPEGKLDAPSITTSLTLDRSNRSSVIASITAARDNAREVREQISSEMWEQINRLYLSIAQTKPNDIWGGHLHQYFTHIREHIHLVPGHCRQHDDTRRGLAFHRTWTFHRTGGTHGRSAGYSLFGLSGEPRHRQHLAISGLGGIAQITHVLRSVLPGLYSRPATQSHRRVYAP